MRKIFLSAALLCSMSLASFAANTPSISKIAKPVKAVVIGKPKDFKEKKKIAELYCEMWGMCCADVWCCGENDEDYWLCVLDAYGAFCP